MAKTREITITIPEYLYEASQRLTALGLFRDLSDLVLAGLRREMREAQRLLEMDPENWQESLDKLRIQIQQNRQLSEPLDEEQMLEQLRAIRQEVWARDYQPYYTLGS
jgi:Arc/MetJ-type ribon-helix-helix transcriptional regulator